MAFDYQEMQDMARELLGPDEFGGSFILQKPKGKPVYDAKTKKNIQLYEELSGVCVMKTYTAETIGSLSNIINAGDVEFKCVMNDNSIIPVESVDKVIFGGHEYNALHVSSVNPNGTLYLVHTIHARRAK